MTFEAIFFPIVLSKALRAAPFYTLGDHRVQTSDQVRVSLQHPFIQLIHIPSIQVQLALSFLNYQVLTLRSLAPEIPFYRLTIFIPKSVPVKAYPFRRRYCPRVVVRGLPVPFQPFSR